MLCLPERYVYGWLFSIRSDSPKLLEYKLSCYDILYAHFHGTITGRIEVLNLGKFFLGKCLRVVT